MAAKTRPLTSHFSGRNPSLATILRALPVLDAMANSVSFIQLRRQEDKKTRVVGECFDLL